jgi:pimeloyl-ACP methyl ester carboxylesterase
MPTIDRDGVTIHYSVHGRPTDQPPLLLTHGYSASSAMWAPNVDALTTGRQLITWDVRGHGRSDSPAELSAYTQAASVTDIAAILDVVGAERAVIGGHSLGGYLSLAFHLAHRERVAALLLIDTGPGFKRDAARDEWNDMAESFAVGFETRGLDALAAGPEVNAGPHDVGGLARAARGILVQRDAAIISSLPDIEVPTLVLVGEYDRPFLAAADYFAKKISRATNVVIAGAGHAPNLDQSAEFDAAVTAFLASLPNETPQ